MTTLRANVMVSALSEAPWQARRIADKFFGRTPYDLKIGDASVALQNVDGDVSTFHVEFTASESQRADDRPDV